jgi:AraC-like DNA-binding protein
MASDGINPTYARLLRLLLGRLGADADALLGAAGLDPHGLLTNPQPLDLAAASRVIAAALRVTGRPWLGLELGWAADAASHGALGFAVVSSPDLRHALQAIERYAVLRTGLLRWRVLGLDGDGDAVLQVDEAQPLGAARGFVLEVVVGTVARVLQGALGQLPPGWRVELPWPAPAWRERYDALGALQWRFDAPALRFHVDRAWLDQPCVSADPAAFEAACRDCEQALAAAADPRSVSERVRERLRAGEAQGYPTLDALAAEWGWSARTLMRRLQHEGTRYQALLDEARQRAALWYLQHSARTVEDIALQLGYADASNFSRTCRRWFGATPQALRAATPSGPVA